jgi:hypothetical protein
MANHHRKFLLDKSQNPEFVFFRMARKVEKSSR